MVEDRSFLFDRRRRTGVDHLDVPREPKVLDPDASGTQGGGGRDVDPSEYGVRVRGEESRTDTCQGVDGTGTKRKDPSPRFIRPGGVPRSVKALPSVGTVEDRCLVGPKSGRVRVPDTPPSLSTGTRTVPSGCPRDSPSQGGPRRTTP